jgi:hypothetical protein
VLQTFESSCSGSQARRGSPCASIPRSVLVLHRAISQTPLQYTRKIYSVHNLSTCPRIVQWREWIHVYTAWGPEHREMGIFCDILVPGVYLYCNLIYVDGCHLIRNGSLYSKCHDRPDNWPSIPFPYSTACKYSIRAGWHARIGSSRLIIEVM